MLLVVGVAGGALAIARHIQRRVELERLRAELRLATARGELARDIHDVTNHALMAVLTQLRVGRRGLGTNDLATAERGLGQAEAAARAAITDLRGLTLLAAGTGPPPPACSSLREVYDQIGEACINFTPTSYDHDERNGPVRPDVATTAIRVVQQCLANAAAHAPGEPLTVVAAREDAWLRIRTHNAICATDEPGLRLGLSIMSQRVADVGGTLEAGVADGAFRVDCRLPLGAAA